MKKHKTYKGKYNEYLLISELLIKFEDLMNCISKDSRLYFTGGEPSVVKGVLKILQRLIDEGLNKNRLNKLILNLNQVDDAINYSTINSIDRTISQNKYGHIIIDRKFFLKLPKELHSDPTVETSGIWQEPVRPK